MAQRRVEAVERALTLLEAFTVQRPALTLTELSQATGFYKSTILRLMASLEHYGYAVRDDRGVYRIGPAIARLGPLAAEDDGLERLIRPVLIALRDATAETAAFHIRDGEQRRCCLVEIGLHEMRHHLEEGAVFEMGAVSERGSGAIERLLKSSDAADGLLIERDASSVGLSVLAIGVQAPDGHMLGVLTLSGATPRFADEPGGTLTVALQSQLAALARHWPAGSRARLVAGASTSDRDTTVFCLED